ncbi:hypothetical protein [Sporocytophaga myxococcoides]|uniref:hypothetical protein n=1 Tax=Sporocytophaga myxococcoides TaxID=153721 RepID=UPI000402A70D|nr:hypothetical protein [Sporocytophaga myxococcoides]
MRKVVIILLLALTIQWKSTVAQCTTDAFGIIQIYPTKAGTVEWNSVHWNNGIPRTIKYAVDSYDPTGWTEDHSGSTNGFKIDGNGIMNMSGGSPRFHVNSLVNKKVPAQQFLNTEFTAYYRRIGNTGPAYGGMVVGARSGPLGHASQGGNDCDATTYYARFRHDGKWDFEKELKHPTSDYWSGSGFHKQDPLWKGLAMPENKWIGMKYVVYNIENNSKVKLELYIDTLSDGNPVNGGIWEKVGELTDEGNWPAAPFNITGCIYSDPKTLILEGHGTFLLRTDGDQAEYKMVSIREIIPGEKSINECVASINRNPQNDIRFYFDNIMKRQIIEADGFFSYQIHDMMGNNILSGNCENSCVVSSDVPSGIYIISFQTASTLKQLKFNNNH